MAAIIRLKTCKTIMTKNRGLKPSWILCKSERSAIACICLSRNIISVQLYFIFVRSRYFRWKILNEVYIFSNFREVMKWLWINKWWSDLFSLIFKLRGLKPWNIWKFYLFYFRVSIRFLQCFSVFYSIYW